MIIKKDLAIIQGYFEDASNLKDGHAGAVILPEDINDISESLKEADQKRTPVTISGAGTGTAGGRIPFGGVVLSLEKLNKIKKIFKSPSGGSVIAEAGVLISDLKEAAGKEGLFYTYDPTEQTAFIGGTIATNASGARSFKYGATRRFTKALTLVLADGTVFKLKRGDYRAENGKFDVRFGRKRIIIPLPTYRMPEVKNAAGYYVKEGMDLVDLFIGQEGTLAVVAESELELVDQPDDIFSCFAFFKKEDDAIRFSGEAKKTDALAIEYFDSNSLDLVRTKNKNVPDYAHSAIFFEQEIDKGNEDEILDKWQKLLSKHSVPLDDTWVAMTEKERRDFSELRHTVPEIINEKVKRNRRPKLSTDIAVPAVRFPEMLRFYKSTLEGCGMEYFLFGHIGDSHLHLNVLPTGEESYNVGKELCMAFIRKAVSLGGTVSAEHGIGKTRREYLRMLYGEKGIREMVAVKKALDPNFILGRGNIIPEEMLT